MTLRGLHHINSHNNIYQKRIKVNNIMKKTKSLFPSFIGLCACLLAGMGMPLLQANANTAVSANTITETDIKADTNTAPVAGTDININTGTNSRASTGKTEKSLKIMETPPEITLYEDDITATSYKLQPVTINGEVNPFYSCYNSTLTKDTATLNGITDSTNVFAIEFTTNCQEFIFKSSSFFRISVDEGNGYELTSYEGYTENPYVWACYKVRFSEKKQRNIKIECTLKFWGVYLQEGDTISKLEREANPKALFVGTSITQGIYRYSNQCNCLVGYPMVVCNLLGFECINNGTGGTGYLTKGATTTYYDRLVTAIENEHPDIIFIEGGPNDVDRYDNNDIVAEAVRCHAYIKEHAPDTKVIIIGLYHHTGYEYLPVKHIDLNKKLRQEALKFGLPYIDLLTGDTIAGDGTVLTEGHLLSADGNCYITGNGNVSNPTGNGNADIYVDTDNYHPTPEGYKFLGLKLSTEIEKILQYAKD